MRNLLGLCALLVACSSSTPVVLEEDASRDAASSWEEAREDASCAVPWCGPERCGLWRCQDLLPAPPAAVALTRGTLTLRPPGAPIRWWGRPLTAPVGHEPVFEIPWHDWNIRGQYAPHALRLPCIPAREPFEKHHIFPQEKILARWFKSKGIDIHAFTLRLPSSFHSWLHSGGPSGGQWNEAWRRFQESHYEAGADDIWRFAFELMDRWGVNGPLVSYYCQDK